MTHFTQGTAGKQQIRVNGPVLSEEQLAWLAAHRVTALSFGMGSNGYPPTPGRAFVILEDDSSWCLWPNGRADRA